MTPREATVFPFSQHENKTWGNHTLLRYVSYIQVKAAKCRLRCAHPATLPAKHPVFHGEKLPTKRIGQRTEVTQQYATIPQGL